jgi:hypothetical protein
MKRMAIVAVLGMLFCAPALQAQASPSLRGGHDHIEAGVFAEYYGLERTRPHINLVGLGGRAAFNVRRNIQLEGEVGYDFKRNFTSTFSNGLTTQLVSTRLRTLHLLAGPKFETSSGPVRAFFTMKAGLVNFSTSDQNALAGFRGALGNVTSGGSSFAWYPGVGAETFLGPVGLRLEVGDEMYRDSGVRHNLKVSFGPHIRF